MTYIIPKFYKYTEERSSKNVAGKIKNLFVQKTLNDYKKYMEDFKTIYNNTIHKRLIEKYLNNIEAAYKFSQNIRNLLFKHSANLEIYDRIRLNFNNNNKYISEIDEIYNKLAEKNINSYFGFTSFQKKEWTLIVNDLIQLYPDLELI